MKLSRRGKRTKCAKRTKRFKLKRNTKKQFRQYKRKNTHRKHSHKLRKNKRVMRGGVEVYPVYENRSVNLKYKTYDSSFMNRARGFMDKFQEGTFRALLSFDGGDKGNKNKFDIGNSVFKNNYAVNGQKGTQYDNIVVFPENAEYHFTLMMNKEQKTFTVNFTLTVKEYKVSLGTYIKYTAKEADRYNPFKHSIGKKTTFVDLGETETKFTLSELSKYEITYHNATTTGDTGKTTILVVQNENGKQVDSISIKSNNDKTYTFPFPNPPNNNYSFFGGVLNKCKETVIQLMEREISAIEPNFTVNTSVNEYPSRIIQSPTDTHTPTPATEGSEPSVPVSMDGEAQQQQQPQLIASV
jgi:hypothetical protein